MKYLSLFVLVLALAGCFGATSEKTGLEGKSLPSFHLLLQDSTTWFSSSRIPAGKPFVILYFSPYCPYCRGEVETITKRMDQLKNIPFYLVTNFPLSAIKQFCNE